jgi:hypothetical protein
VIESPDEEGVGRTLMSVAVGCEEIVAVAGAIVDSLALEQALSMNSPMNRKNDVFFIGGNGIYPILIRSDDLSRFPMA